MRIVTAAQMRDIEAYADHKLGIPALLLMENAALGAAAQINAMDIDRGALSRSALDHGALDRRALRKRITVVCGPGNNGGDGFALARKLFAGGWEVVVIFVGEAAKLGGEARLNLDILYRMGVPVHGCSDGGQAAVVGWISAAEVVVDALFGIGLTRAPEGLFAEMIRAMNNHGRYIVALDIPSGVDADTGHVFGEAVRAHSTVTFGFMKPGLLLYPGASYAGDVTVADLSIPGVAEGTFSENKPTAYKSLGYMLADADIPGLLPHRPRVSHKGRFGRVRIYAGSRDMPGAAVLCCAAAYRIGAGVVEVCAVEEVAQAVRLHVPEALATVLPGKNGRSFTDVVCVDTAHSDAETASPSVLLIGPGLGQGAEVTAFVRKLLTDARCPVVLDADGLNAIAAEPAVLRRRKATDVAEPCTVAADIDVAEPCTVAADIDVAVPCTVAADIDVAASRIVATDRSAVPPCVVTPHPGEMSRMTGRSVADIVANPIETARTFAQTYGVYTLLKGARTVVATPEGVVFINTTGSSALAKAGSGDALAGMIAGLLAQGVTMAHACALGAYLHGKAGERAGMLLSTYGVNATDTIRMLPEVLRGYVNL